ncbi:MAG: LptF/LptG family permease [Cytophagaceae bacterium]|jgi:lipopolysaccharide export system permease protein|nr:LptF/LptG family permease [Cytophagaceae bacterium]
MKKLHFFILKSYLGPFVLTFFIALFVLMMQFLWKYVDDMVGKGLEWHVLAELLFYASLQVVPMALPLAILLASLMTFGSLGENYELTALKSAGISLPRIMLPLIALTICTSYGAYKFSNDVLPVANLKLYSLLHGIRETRLEMDIKEKVFYQGVDDFAIKVDEKNRETNMLYNVMIYDHRDRMNRNSNVTLADSGKLQMASDKKNLIITLFDGVRYDEKLSLTRSKPQSNRDSKMFHTDIFKEQTSIIQVQGFDFAKTDESLFRNSDRMKNIEQLRRDIDSLRGERNVYVKGLSDLSANFYFNRLPQYDKNQFAIVDTAVNINIDSVFNALPASQQKAIVEYALRQARDSKLSIDDQMRYISREDNKIRRHLMEYHRKYTLSFACFIFFFIGAPLGAIIRKGGLGLPVVISILLFISYYIIDTSGSKFAIKGAWTVYQGIWLSSAVLLPMGVFLTYKATTDSPLMNADAYIIFFQKVRAFVKKWGEVLIAKNNDVIQTIFNKK